MIHMYERKKRKYFFFFFFKFPNRQKASDLEKKLHSLMNKSHIPK